ncbi:hypothetical protein KUTeg_020473 [Tegillarca granosa]|uniref:Short-chain collagen C4 n=1 Tax=Tegillarca granosa TaxID=220873 RepID=A0ABQ9EAR8_TEGGR|nr:hypothetical protein KUTeg_020473 [Tegillarca granosa]
MTDKYYRNVGVLTAFSGYAAGADYQRHAGTDTQCLPKDPNWRKYHDAKNEAAYIYGSEYQMKTYLLGEALYANYHDYDVPCAVCQSQKCFNVHMVPDRIQTLHDSSLTNNVKFRTFYLLNKYLLPFFIFTAKDRCYNGWHLEYRGYLMTQYHSQAASNYVCVDAKPEKIGSMANHNGRLFYPVESMCGALPCPPYVNHRELTCAVCTF